MVFGKSFPYKLLPLTKGDKEGFCIAAILKFEIEQLKKKAGN
jgi:hypothetical protein